MSLSLSRYLILAGITLTAALRVAAADPLELDFKNPPEGTRPRCYWYWMEGNITQDGITKDLEAMQRVGIGAAYIGVIHGQSNGQPGAIQILGEPFWDAMAHAIREGTRLGVDIGVFNSPGWSQSGGPWVKPPQTMRHLALPEVRLRGPQRFTGKLPQPPGEFQDVSIIAFPAPLGEDEESQAVFEGKKTRAAQLWTFEMPQPTTARSLTVTPAGAVRVSASLEASDDGTEFRPVHSFTIDRHNLEIGVGSTPLAPVVVSFPETTARMFRVVLSGPANIGDMQLSAAARVDDIAGKSLEKVFQDPLPPFDFYTWPAQAEPSAAGYAVAPDSVRDLSGNLQPDGSFTWEVPEGDWVVLRTGMVPTGSVNSPAAPEATGLEVDKMNRQAVKGHFDSYIGKLLARLKPEERKSWKYVVGDSYEKGPQNWTDGFAAIFSKRYGYDPSPFLPVLTGRLVGSADQSNRFLWDLRRLIADQVATEYVGGLRDLCHKNGLKLWLENYGHWGFPSEFLLYGGQSDELGGEFWESGDLGKVELRDASSAAHIYGKRQVFAEAWTGGPLFRSTPWSLKKRGDWAMCEGINQFVFHVNIHQPWEDKKPGVSAWFGTEFNRHNTWFGMSKSWMDYLRRCSFLLQQGHQVADVAYFIGEDAPKMTGLRQPELPAGHDFDYINADVLLNRARVENGRLVLTDGMSYQMLVLPPSETMRPATLAKIKSFVDGGLTVVGPLPTRSPSLEGFPDCDARVKDLSESLAGRVMSGGDLKDALKLPPDVTGLPAGKVLFSHRRTPELEIYFLSNQGDSPALLEPVFRVTGMVPEIWHPDSGEIERPPGEGSNGVTRVPLRLDARGSVFVVFRKETQRTIATKKTGNLEIRNAVYEAVDGSGSADATAKVAAAVGEGRLDLTVTNDLVGSDPAFQRLKQLRVDYVVDGNPRSVTVAENQPLTISSGTELTGAWDVEFGSEKARFEQLVSWPERPEPSIKYHSGEAIYHTTFQAPAVAGNTVTMLDLGKVESMAEVTLNGHVYPVLWKPPYRLDVSAVLRPDSNQLSVRVVNVWHNRLVGERHGIKELAGPPVWGGNIPNYAPNEALLPSGLIGPVRIATLEVTR
ncbi:MAG: glycosyl hydrolase [Verrucomicrobiota bacterium]